MGIDSIILIIIVIAGFAILFFILKKKESNVGDKLSKELQNQLVLLQSQINEMNKVVDSKLGETNKTMLQAIQSQSSQANKIVREVTEKLTRLDETNKQVVNFADQLKNLQDILKNPKQRGVLGEYYLETVLKNVLPPGTYQMQYDLGIDPDTGKKLIPDAVVFIKDKIIPIDSKFSLENYNRLVEASNDSEKDKFEKIFVNDLKGRIKEVSKYIQPSKNTMDFAFMFIPHEAIYYDLLTNNVGAIQDSQDNLIQRAASKYHVIIVSPTSFLAYLQTVLQGLRALQIEESAKEIRKNVEKLGKHLLNYDSYLKKLGAQIGTVVNTYNTGYKEFNKINKDVTKITNQENKLEVLEIEKPKQE